MAVLTRPRSLVRGCRADLLARVAVTVGALLPYWPLLTLRTLYVTDDFFTSDIYNGELPGRVLVGQLIRGGEWPVWTAQLCSGLPIAGAPMDLLGLLTFTMLPPAMALDVYVIAHVLVAAHGAYWLARRMGADRTGAVLAGIAFAGCGYIATQLKHLGIIGTVVWLPVGLGLIDRGLGVRVPTAGTAQTARRGLAIALFGLVFANQVLVGFPQSAYICALTYGVFAAFRMGQQIRARSLRLGSWTALLGAVTLGAAAGAVTLLPLSSLGAVSDRSQPLGYAWSTQIAYWPPNVLNFFLPYAFGDISNRTYIGPSLFWEDYGYAGLVTMLVAIFGGFHQRRQAHVRFFAVLTLVSYAFVLGRATPAYYFAYRILPGLSQFRFPTRFLIVVELGLVVLAAIGLTKIRSRLEQEYGDRSAIPAVAAAVLCLVTALDLAVHQSRQNPMVPATPWLSAPSSVRVIRGDSVAPRTYTPEHGALHRQAFEEAKGWTDTRPYFEMRQLLQPNIGAAYWSVPSGDCYTGIAPRWTSDVWGDHNRLSALVPDMTKLVRDKLFVTEALPNLLRTFGVSHVLAPAPVEGVQGLTLVSDGDGVAVHRVSDAARVRVVRAARRVSSDDEALQRLRDPSFDPDREVLLHDTSTTTDSQVSGTVTLPVDEARTVPAGGTDGRRAAIVHERSNTLTIAATAPDDSFLLLADTYYPGWTAVVDGVSVPVYRANLAVRAIRLPAGTHSVVFAFDPPGFFRGLWISAAALSVLLVWVAAALYAARSGGTA